MFKVTAIYKKNENDELFESVVWINPRYVKIIQPNVAGASLARTFISIDGMEVLAVKDEIEYIIDKMKYPHLEQF